MEALRDTGRGWLDADDDVPGRARPLTRALDGQALFRRKSVWANRDVRKNGEELRVEGDEWFAYTHGELDEQSVVGGHLRIHRTGKGSAP